MPKTIMVVDDDPGNVLTLQSFLKDRGYNVIIANDGQEALVKLATVKPDLILLDIMMPRMDGTELAMAVRDDARLRSTPIFYLTAVITADDAVESLGPRNTIFPKPVNFAELLNKIREVIGTSQPT